MNSLSVLSKFLHEEKGWPKITQNPKSCLNKQTDHRFKSDYRMGILFTDFTMSVFKDSQNLNHSASPSSACIRISQ